MSALPKRRYEDIDETCWPCQSPYYYWLLLHLLCSWHQLPNENARS